METVVEWNTKKLDELGFVGRGKSKHRPRNDPSLFDGEYPFFQTGDVKAANYKLRNFSQTYNEKGLAQSKLWEPGTLCITIAANIADTSILDIPGCFPDSVVGFVSNPKESDVRFVKYAIDNIKLQMRNISRGTTQDNLSLDKLLTFDIPTPGVDYQTKIANVLSGYDELIENNLKRITILESMAQFTFDEWFTKLRYPGHSTNFTNATNHNLPNGWTFKKVEEIIERCSPGKLYSLKTANEHGVVPILDQGKTGIIGYHDDEPGLSPTEEMPVIVFANHTCYQKIIQFPFSAIQNVLPFVPSTGINMNIYWLHWATKDLVSFNDYKGHWPEFMNKKVLVPDRQTAELFGSKVEPIVRLIYRLDSSNKKLADTRELLIPRLVSGEIEL